MKQHKWTLMAVGVATLAIAIIAPTYAVWPALGFEPPVIASLDLERVFNEIDRLQDAQDDLEAGLQQFQDQAEALRQEAEKLRADLDLLVPGTEKYAKAEKMPEGEKTDDEVISLLVEKGWDVDNAFQVRKEVEHFMTELDEIPLNAIVGQEDNFSSDYGYSLKIIEPDTPSTEPDTSSIEPDTSSI